MNQEDLNNLVALVCLYITGYFGAADVMILGRPNFAQKIKLLDPSANPPEFQIWI